MCLLLIKQVCIIAESGSTQLLLPCALCSTLIQALYEILHYLHALHSGRCIRFLKWNVVYHDLICVAAKSLAGYALVLPTLNCNDICNTIKVDLGVLTGYNWKIKIQFVVKSCTRFFFVPILFITKLYSGLCLYELKVTLASSMSTKVTTIPAVSWYHGGQSVHILKILSVTYQQ